MISDQSIIETIISEITECALAVCKENCDEYEQQLYTQVSELSKQKEKVIAKLTQEERQILEDYIVKSSLIAQHECQYLYVQGAKDCIVLLKKLGVL